MWETSTITFFLCLAGLAILICGLSRVSVWIEHRSARHRWVPITRLWHGITTQQEYEPLSVGEIESATNDRANDLWVEAGQPGGREFCEFLNQAQREFEAGEFYHFKHNGRVFVYQKHATDNIKEGLSFLKDWVTSLIQLETGALAVFGLAAGFKEVFTSAETTSHSSANASSAAAAAGAIPVSIKIFAALELFFIVFSGLSILISMAYGLMLLNALPGAVQRVPASAAARQSDVFAISNEPWHYSIYMMVERFRSWFFIGIIVFSLFVLARLLEQFYRIVSG
jgi:hypothetical protein